MEGKNVAQTPTLNIVNQELLSNLTDPTVIHEHLERIGGGIERNDPAQAIGSSKELIESTAELVRGEAGVGKPAWTTQNAMTCLSRSARSDPHAPRHRGELTAETTSPATK